jgi:hypothetical protein
MAGSGRPPVPIEEARAFGRLVIRERKPGESLDAVFVRIRRREPRRWRSIRTMWRLWSAFRADQRTRVEPKLDMRVQLKDPERAAWPSDLARTRVEPNFDMCVQLKDPECDARPSDLARTRVKPKLYMLLQLKERKRAAVPSDFWIDLLTRLPH